MLSGNSISAKKLYLLYDRDLGHYSVITTLKLAMAKTYICNGCGSVYDKTQKRDKVCSLCTAKPPRTKEQTKCCDTFNRRFLIEKCFQNQVTLKVKGKPVCQCRLVFRNCSYLVTSDSKHERLRNFVIIVIRNNLLAIFATCLH